MLLHYRQNILCAFFLYLLLFCSANRLLAQNKENTAFTMWDTKPAQQWMTEA